MSRYELDPDFDEDAGAARRGGRTRYVVMAAAAVVLIGFAGLMWYAYRLGVQSGRDGDVPLVQAPGGGELGHAPKDDGLPPVPNADKRVYQALEGVKRSTAAGDEKLLPLPEAPVAPLPPPPPPPPAPAAEAPPAPAAGSPQAEQGGPATLAAEDQPGVSESTAPDATAPAVGGAATAPGGPDQPGAPPPKAELPEAGQPTVAQPQPDQAKPDQAKPEQPKAEPPKPADRAKADAKAEPPPVSLGPGYRLQLGAYGSAREAEDAGRRLKRRNADLLGRLTFVAEPVHRAGKPTLYRLQAGPLSQEALADLVCDQLKGRKVPCFVVSH